MLKIDSVFKPWRRRSRAISQKSDKSLQGPRSGRTGKTANREHYCNLEISRGRKWRSRRPYALKINGSKKGESRVTEKTLGRGAFPYMRRGDRKETR